MKKVIVTTTIYSPSKAIKKFEKLKDWDLIVVGDKKTPEDYELEKGIYVTPEMQEKYDKDLSDAIGWNCIQRRNFGFLWAHDMGADIIATIDDDNIPYENWGKNVVVGSEIEANFYDCDLPVFDPIGATNERHLWHRGYPVQLLAKRDYSKKSKRVVKVDIQADFWNGDPDVDAICRFEHAPESTFDPSCFPLASNKISPFNSQNTFLSKSVLPHYFVMPHVGRMDDIWPSFYVQALGYKVVYMEPTVYQDRNEQDLTDNMRNEFHGYEKNLQLVRDLYEDPEKFMQYLPPTTLKAYQLYGDHFK